MATPCFAQAAQFAGWPLDRLAARGGAIPSVLALIYHRIGGRTDSPVDLPVRLFVAQLEAVADRVVPLSNALAITQGACDQPAGAPAVVLTFDDGTSDWVDVVMPLLTERQLPATFYVATRFVEEQRPFPDDGVPLSWSGLREIAGSGLVTVGSHTHSHRVLARATLAEASEELDRSQGLLQDHLGLECRDFAYPNAVLGSPAAELAVRRRFRSAALAGNRLNAVDRTDLHRFRRHGLTVGDGMPAFHRKAAGGGLLEGWLRDRLAAVRSR